MRYFVLTAGVLIMAGCQTFHPYRAGAPEGAIDVIAHRGASAYRPENTLAAFQHAIEQGADWFELDCTVARDLSVVVIHDDTLDRTTSGTGPIADLTLAQIRDLDAGSWFAAEYAGEPLPTLAESLDLAKGKIGVYCEIKNSDNDSKLMKDILDELADVDVRTPDTDALVIAMIEHSLTRNLPLTRNAIAEIRARNMEKDVVIQSFSPIICAIALIEAPEIRTEYLASRNEDKPAQWESCLRWLRLLNAPGFNISMKSVSPELIEQMHAEGRSVAVWTVDDPEQMRQLVERNVDAIITNVPDVCIQTLEELGKHRKKTWWE